VSAPLVPSPLDYIGPRRFAFYPPIRNTGPNQWVLGVGSWSEVQAINAETGRELWVPRQHIGAVSDTGHSLLTVGLRKALDLRSGSLEPRVKRVIEMPHWSSDDPTTSDRASIHPASIVAIRLEDKKSAMSKAVVGVTIGALLACLLAGLIGSAARGFCDSPCAGTHTR
jgi:hypothetical protein